MLEQMNIPLAVHLSPLYQNDEIGVTQNQPF